MQDVGDLLMAIAHKLIGFVFIGVFVATGVYMRIHFPDAYQGDPGMRMMFRSAHVYMLFSALLNLLLGAHMRQRTSRWRMLLQNFGSWCLLVSPGLFTAAFFIEPAPQQLHRPIAVSGVILALTGAILHTVASHGTDVPNQAVQPTLATRTSRGQRG